MPTTESDPSPCEAADPAAADAWVHDYFARHLGERMHQPLLPGLASLNTAFSIQVTGAGTWSLAIESGVIERCEATDARDPSCHVTLSVADFAEIVVANCTPQSLFIRRRLRIEGEVFRALSAAAAMQEFFQHFPYRSAPR